MRKTNDAAVMALLLPNEPDGIDDAYLESLVDELERRRTAFARDVAGYMRGDFGPLAPAQIARVRAKHLDELLGFRPADMEAVLLDMMSDEEDFGRAAALLLYGHAKGFWQPSDAALGEARELADLPPDAAALEIEKLEAFAELIQSFFDTLRDRRDESTEDAIAFVKRLGPATASARKMRATLANAQATPDQRLVAIRRWLDALAEAGEHALAIEFCIMGRLALLRAQAQRSAH